MDNSGYEFRHNSNLDHIRILLLIKIYLLSNVDPKKLKFMYKLNNLNINFDILLAEYFFNLNCYESQVESIINS